MIEIRNDLIEPPEKAQDHMAGICRELTRALPVPTARPLNERDAHIHRVRTV